MIPKNADLFTGLTALEALFVRPEEQPWRALFRMSAFMTACKLRVRKWPERFFPISYSGEDENGMDRHRGVMKSFGKTNIRGGSDLTSDDHTLISGPVFLGNGVTLRKGAVVTGPAWIGDGVVIGQGCRIKHSILLPGSEIVYATRLTASLIGRGVRVGPGTVSEAVSFKGGTISYTGGNGRQFHGDEVEAIDTYLLELGLFAGDRSFIGGRTIASPGVILKPDTRVQEGSRLQGQKVFEGIVTS